MSSKTRAGQVGKQPCAFCIANAQLERNRTVLFAESESETNLAVQ